jgi:hypothetical protein
LATALDAWPANGVFIKHIPVLRRMTAASFIYAMTRAMMYIITSFGLVYLTEGLGYYGLWIVIMPVTAGYMWAVRYFERIESIEKPSVHEVTGTYEEFLLNPDKNSFGMTALASEYLGRGVIEYDSLPNVEDGFQAVLLEAAADLMTIGDPHF